jgi:hypothetical protein
VIFFYEILFVGVAVAAVFIGEQWSRTLAVVFLLAWLGLVTVGCASFDARLAAAPRDPEGSRGYPGGLADDERRWFVDARDGLRHLRLLFGLATAAALVWRVVAG